MGNRSSRGSVGKPNYKKAKLDKDKQVVKMVSGKSSEIRTTRAEFRKPAVAPKGIKTLKGCLALGRLPKRLKKTVRWQIQDDIGIFERDSVVRGDNFGRDSQDKDSRRGANNGNIGRDKNNRNFGRVASGMPKKKKRKETACRFFRKGGCSKGSRCKFLHAVVPTSCPSDHSAGSYPPPDDHHHCATGDCNQHPSLQ